MLLKLYLTTEKDIAYYQSIAKGRVFLMVESVILALAAALLYAFLDYILIIIPLIFAIINLMIVPYKIKEAKWEAQGKSIKFRTKRTIYLLFMYIDLLCKKVVEKGGDEETAEKIKVEYVNRLINEKTPANITQLTKDVKTRYQKLSGENPKEFKSMDVEKFSSTKAKKWMEKYYPDLEKDINNNEYSKNKNKAIVKQTPGMNNLINIDRELRILGLPGSTRDFEFIKARYYELVKRYHPDAPENKDKDIIELQEKITEINLAYREIEKAMKNNNPKK